MPDAARETRRTSKIVYTITVIARAGTGISARTLAGGNMGVRILPIGARG